MFARAHRILAGLVVGLVPGLLSAGIISYPGIGDPTYSQAELDAARAQGRLVGRQEASAECIGDPGNCGCADALSPCGVTLSSLLTDAQFGETEPNDHIIAADPMITAALYWGQSRSLIDQDWYYVTTVEPNQLLTVTFTVPQRVLVDNTRLSQGWLISVRDAANNIYAQFDTRFALDDPATADKNESQEIVYPVFLGHVGTYYVVVEPAIAETDQADPNSFSILYWPYNVASVLTFSGLDAAPPDVNFHDVEVEPNDLPGQANALASGVTMYGMLRQTADAVGEDADGNPVFLQGDLDWFKYTTAGDEQVVLAWCGREACSEGAVWFIEVQNPHGVSVLSLNTDKAETLHFGLGEPGDYYMRVGFQRKSDAECLEYKAQPECLVSSYQCQVLQVTAGTAATNGVDTCRYGAGTICETGSGSLDSVECLVTGEEEVESPEGSGNYFAPRSHPVWKWEEVCSEFGYACKDDGYAPVVDPNALSVEYNFTWWGTGQPPLSSGSQAEQDFMSSWPTFYADPF